MMKKRTWMLDIRRFDAAAEPYGGINATTTTTLTAEMKTYYDKQLLKNTKPELVHDRWGQERPIPAGSGKTVEFRRYSSLGKALTPLTEGVTPAGQKLTVTAITATVAQYGGFVALTDMLTMTAIDNNIVEATAEIGTQAGLTLDTITRNALQEGTNVVYSSKKAADGTETAVTSRAGIDKSCRLTVKDVYRMAAMLKRYNVKKIDGYYICILHPFVAYDLMMEAGDLWVQINKDAHPENLENGEIGRLGGVRFFESSEAKIYYGTADSCAANTAVFGTLFFGKDAYGKTELENGGLKTIVKQLGSGDDPLDQRATVGWKATKTAKILSDEALIRYECGSSMGGQITASN